jgi:hypothetical protein
VWNHSTYPRCDPNDAVGTLRCAADAEELIDTRGNLKVGSASSGKLL